LLALKNTTRAQRLYQPVARRQSVRKARQRVWAWSIIALVATVVVINYPEIWVMWLFTVIIAVLMYKLVAWQDVAQRRWEREHTL